MWIAWVQFTIRIRLRPQKELERNLVKEYDGNNDRKGQAK